MMNKLKNVILLYVHNTGFKLLTLILIFCAFESKWLYHQRNILAEDVFSLLFVICIWFLFHIGLMIKSQFAHARASLLPGYRKVHLVGILSVAIFFVVILWMWTRGFQYQALVSFHGLIGVYLVTVLVGIILLILGYLSIGKLLLYAYVFLLAISIQTERIIWTLDNVPYLNSIICIIIGLMIVIFARRLLTLKEECAEYSYMISWPSKKVIVNQMKKFSSFSFFDLPVLCLLKSKVKQDLRMGPYPATSNILLRALHWEKGQNTHWGMLCLQLGVMMGIYIGLLKTTNIFQVLPTKIYLNFLLFTITPVVLTLGSQYKQMLYWSYDLLKPVSRTQFIMEKAVMFLVQLFGFWIFISVIFGYLPVKILAPFLLDGKLAFYLLLTFIFSFFTLAVIAFLSVIEKSWMVIILGFVYIQVALVLSVFIVLLTIKQLLLCSLIFLVVGGILSYLAYGKWINKEFT